MIRLLEPANHLTQPDAPSVEIFGETWVIVEYAQLSDAPAYTCISYAWGEEKVKNSLFDGQIMSARTIPAIEATICASQSQESWADNIRFSQNGDPLKEAAGQSAAPKASQAFWIDALCVPSKEPARTACLQSMGEMYSSDFQVFVVLTKSCSEIFRCISCTGKLEPTDLLALEREDWINRAWAYQEAVNSKALYFVVDDDINIIVSGSGFLNAIMKATDEYKLLHNLDNISRVKYNPRLYYFEAFLADYHISDYATRSAYQVMSVMGQRDTERADDFFYAMIGAITPVPLAIEGDETLHPSEYFMRICENKGDYSFIYNVAPRCDVLGRRWRPVLPSCLLGVTALCQSYESTEPYATPKGLSLSS